MTLPKSLTTVTIFSKILAMFLFLLLPFAGFYMGYRYYQSVIKSTTIDQIAENSSTSIPIASIPAPTIDNVDNWVKVDDIIYSFKIPKGWKGDPYWELTYLPPNGPRISNSHKFDKENATITVKVMNKSYNQSVEDISELNGVDAESLKVAGRKATKFQLKNRNNASLHDTIVVPYNSQNIPNSSLYIVFEEQVSSRYAAGYRIIDDKMIDQVLSTFKFTQ